MQISACVLCISPSPPLDVTVLCLIFIRASILASPSKTFHQPESQFAKYQSKWMRWTQGTAPRETDRNRERERDFLTWERSCSCFSCSTACNQTHTYRLHLQKIKIDQDVTLHHPLFLSYQAGLYLQKTVLVNVEKLEHIIGFYLQNCWWSVSYQKRLHLRFYSSRHNGWILVGQKDF